LTAYIVKTTEPIYVFFGTIHYRIVLNIAAKPIGLLDKFVILVASRSDKINNSGFHLQNQARQRLQSNVSICKIQLKYNSHNFGTAERRDILNMPIIQHFV